MSVTSHVFRGSDIVHILNRYAGGITIPHLLERALNRSPIFRRPLMMCFDESKFINNLANQVQTMYPFRNFGVSLEQLEKGFLEGKRLSLEHMRKEAAGATDCFVQIGYEWEHGE